MAPLSQKDQRQQGQYLVGGRKYPEEITGVYVLKYSLAAPMEWG